MADIVIQGMEMPKDGYVYIEMLLKVADGKIYYNYTGEKKVYTADFLTLPEGHGKLGDLDALMPDFVKAKWEFFSDSDTFLRLLEQAPTIIPAERDGKDD